MLLRGLCLLHGAGHDSDLRASGPRKTARGSDHGALTVHLLIHADTENLTPSRRPAHSEVPPHGRHWNSAAAGWLDPGPCAPMYTTIFNIYLAS